MSDFEFFILLMSVAVLLVSVAKKANIPYPIVLVIGGSLLSFVPGLNYSYLDPNLILAVVLPPILYYAAFWTSLGDFKKHARQICSLAFSLVLITTVASAVLFKWCFPEYSWALAFAFGAIVSPPDAAAATAILKRFNLSQKLITILEGESLVNDASALVLYRIAVIAILSGTFSWWDATFNFVFMSLGGVALGAAFGYCIQIFSRRYLDPVVGAFSSFLIPYITYILALLADVSGVLAVVASGIVASRIVFRHHSPLRRMIGRVSWDMYIIMLNCFVFVLIGSQLDEQTSHMNWHQVFTYTGYALLITTMMFIIRFLWVCIGSAIRYHRLKNEPLLASSASIVLRDSVIIGWAGMRGIVSLTAALALPIALSDGTLVAGRAEVIYVVFCVILFTLIVPGLTLPALISWLKIPQEQTGDTSLETRRRLAKVAQEEISRLHATRSVSDDERSFLNDYFTNKFRLWELVSPENEKHHTLESARKKVVQAQRRVLLQTWEVGNIDDKVLEQIQHDLDAEETRNPRAEI